MGRRIAITAVVVCLAVLFIAIVFTYRVPRGGESSADESAMSYEKLMSRILLIPIDEKARQFYEGGSSGLFGVSETPEDTMLARVAKRRDFDCWKRYEDDVLSFAYPDAPHVKLEIKNPNDRILIDGAPVRSDEYSFSKAYQMVVGKHPSLDA